MLRDFAAYAGSVEIDLDWSNACSSSPVVTGLGDICLPYICTSLSPKRIHMSRLPSSSGKAWTFSKRVRTQGLADTGQRSRVPLVAVIFIEMGLLRVPLLIFIFGCINPNQQEEHNWKVERRSEVKNRYLAEYTGGMIFNSILRSSVFISLQCLHVLRPVTYASSYSDRPLARRAMSIATWLINCPVTISVEETSKTCGQ